MDLNQVTLSVNDFDKSVSFYEKLGLILIVSARKEYARFELPSENSTLSLHISERNTTSEVVHYFEVDDVDHKFMELETAGIVFETEPKDESWLWREARFSDPSGNRLCIYHAGRNRRYPPWRI